MARLTWFATLAAILLGTAEQLAADRGATTCAERSVSAQAVYSPDDARAFATCAKEYLEEVGADAAYDAFHNDPRWHSSSTYVFIFEEIPDFSRARMFVHAADPVREMTAPGAFGDLTDDFGTDIIAEAVRVVRANEGGYWYYQFTNPETGTVDPKASYVVKVDWRGTPAVLGAGVYLRDLPSTCRDDEVSATELAADPTNRHLAEFVRCAAFRLQADGYFATWEFENEERWSSGPIYLFGLDLSGNHIFSGSPVRINGSAIAEWAPIGSPTDQFGGRDIPAIGATFGEAFIYYRAFNPGTGQRGRKVAMLKRVTAFGVPILLGAGYYID